MLLFVGELIGWFGVEEVQVLSGEWGCEYGSDG